MKRSRVAEKLAPALARAPCEAGEAPAPADAAGLADDSTLLAVRDVPRSIDAVFLNKLVSRMVPPLMPPIIWTPYDMSGDTTKRRGPQRNWPLSPNPSGREMSSSARTAFRCNECVTAVSRGYPVGTRCPLTRAAPYPRKPLRRASNRPIHLRP
ncbi:hypothetical protein EN871_24115 [bacterium M00.F.Ca.ET.228.01.1.1]|uniref:hypothetical protein n=1 Tax=Paraburkholderia phenoliruptrix TaxID=252970 RepID=UPI001091E3EE|nr:hypothetical protein [Paraburkholderia phenoliruptrix]TGP41540.1 hypothetical protein EN871_24115 [bacterium M00.F.Ca.ET.228.01.1.1]TGR98198.1 hypothetical protein EN834_23730 [bacterium M00.F.Ca.ET.191.01.1.1]TGU02389.1 hypothetical protein EN798_24550 [bacterium M00.F.Ca.ET.155.01.1.1]MBW0447192.1 hypothetical protein [Paraburkholderia phenoliruptrix]MBW9101425.1 hypothetical protein [Paraburkholderia phenoliruptrix]